MAPSQGCKARIREVAKAFHARQKSKARGSQQQQQQQCKHCSCGAPLRRCTLCLERMG